MQRLCLLAKAKDLAKTRCELFLYILIGNDEMHHASMDPWIPGFTPSSLLLVNRAT